MKENQNIKKEDIINIKKNPIVRANCNSPYSPYSPQENSLHRRSIRLKGYDYSQAGLYFITLCIQYHKNIFGKIIDGEMKLNEFGKIAEKEWLNTEKIRENCSLGAFIIMPNHFHAIISIDYQINKSEDIGKFKSPSQTIGAIIRGFKGTTTKKIKEYIINFNNSPKYKSEKEYNNCTGELQLEQRNKSKFQSKSTGELQFALNFLNNRIKANKSIWQRDYWEHIIRNEKEYHRITQYIINNPKKWQNDKLKKENENNIRENKSPYNEEPWMI